jgi:1,2-diacylglycerol 3-alpha-glucosyltransferase
MKVALLCSGLGRVHRGHEVFARDLFSLVGRDVGMTLFKGGGESLPDERVLPHIPRDAACLDGMQLPVSPKWQHGAQEQERIEVEGSTFASSALGPLLEGDFDIVHCLEQEVCRDLYAKRHLFRRTPAFLFSNGGAIPKRKLPACDFVQEHTDHNLQQSARDKAFMIPHGVDTQRFRPGLPTTFRERHGIPRDVRLVISVGSIGHNHKRMDHVVREVAAVPGAWLAMLGQETRETPDIRALAAQLIPDRVTFATLPHDQLPEAYAAADVFVLGSLFETFGIAYIEAMAMGLPVIATNHPNQRAIIGEGWFVDMNATGAVAALLANESAASLRAMGERARASAVARYDLQALRQRYIAQYAAMAGHAAPLPRHGLKQRLLSNARNLLGL